MFDLIFYTTASGNDVVADFIRSLPREDRRKVGEDLRTLQRRYPLGMPLCRPLGKGLWELRSSLPSGRECRIFYTFVASDAILVGLHGFLKTSQTTPDREIKLARKRLSEVE
jgi:phage-related protein